MVFEVKNKVALVTGGASGFGLEHTKELLRSGVKGVTVADINDEGFRVVEDLQREFGEDRVIFVKTDVVEMKSFENAFLATIKTFKHIDILINNAGIGTDATWELLLDINLKGTINGLILGIDNYLPKFKQGDEAVVLNTGSVVGIWPFSGTPIYCATKAAVIALTKSWGDRFHYDRTKVRVLAICPGPSLTPMLEKTNSSSFLKPEYFKAFEDCPEYLKIYARPDHIARESVKVLENGPIGSVWVMEGDDTVYEFNLPDSQFFKA